MEEDKDYINLIHGDLTRATQIQNGLPDSIGVMSIKTANWTILEASLLPTPRALWNSFGYEGSCPASLRIPMWASLSLPCR